MATWKDSYEAHKYIYIFFRVKINGKTESESRHRTFQNTCEYQ